MRMNSVFSGFAAALIAGGALAADLPRKSAPATPVFTRAPAFTWTGFYAGVNAGYGFGNFTGPSAGNFADPKGFIGGGQIGYNHQIDQFVFGLETDISYADINAKASATGVAGSKARINYLGTVRGRAGVAMDRFMPYLTAGFAYGGTNVTIPGTGRSSTAHYGWTAGGGVEYAFTNNLTARVEGLYVDLTDKRILGGAGKIGAEAAIIRAGINAKF